MNFGKILRGACAASFACVPAALWAQATNPPLAPVPAYMVNPGVTGPFIANQPVVPPANNGAFIVPENYGGAPVMGPGMVCPPVCPPMCGPVCPQPCCPPANFDPYYSPLPGAGAPIATMPGGINWNTTAMSGAGITPRFGGGYLDGEHVGLNDGYIWLEGWVPIWQTPGQNVFFADVNTLKYNDGNDQWGFNGHGGYRWFNCATNRIWGFYGGYDYRDVGTANFDQISGGVESLGPLWDFRGNAYYVLGDDTAQIAVSDPFFVGPNLAVNTTNVDAYSGFDAEVGRNFTPQNPTLAVRGFIGGYWFSNSNALDDVLGGRARIEARWWNRFTIEGGVNYDNVFDTTVWLAGSILFGGSQTGGGACGCPPTIVDRLADPLYKNRHIVVNERIEQELVINPATDLPLFILHVDSNGPGPGLAGTFEDPFLTLAAAEGANNADVDIILARGGSTFNGQSIDLNIADQRFLGDGDLVRHTVGSQFGTLTLPRANGSPEQPIISNTVGDAIEINAANVEVSGFDVRFPSDHGIQVNNVEGFNINRNLITGANADGLLVGNGINVNFAGTANGTGTIADNAVTGGQLTGILIDTSGGGSFDGTITGNDSSGNTDDGFDIGEVAGGTISGNTADGNTDDGFDIATFSGGTLADNSATGNGSNGFEFTTVSGGTIEDNTSVANGADGFFFSSITGGLIDGNTALNNTDDGFDINAFTGGQFNNNIANNNGDDGFETSGVGGTASASNNNAIGNGGSNVGFNFP